jgi:apolipoprotein N-acyltransferase
MASRTRRKRIVWFAKGGGIAKCGPFDTQIEATNAMRLVKNDSRTRIAYDFRKGGAHVGLVHELEQNAEFPPDVFVWPEEAKESKHAR